MRIKYAVGFNWGNLSRKTYPFEEGLNMMVGDTGSGKSTLMDLIQSVITADLKEVRNYNAGQSEVTTRKKAKTYRSYAAYLLGADQFQFTRKASLGITACVFEDKDGEQMTAWLFGRAEVQGSGENQRASGGVESLGICMGHALTEEDFTKTNQKGELEIKEMEELHRHLKSVYGRDSEIFSSRKDYLMRLFGAFNGVSSIQHSEAVKAAKAFVKYIYPSQTDDVHKFVRDELLEERDLSDVIKKLKEIMQSYSNIQKEAEAISHSKDTLEKVVLAGKRLLNTWRLHYDDNYLFGKRKEYRYLKDITAYEKELSLHVKKTKKAQNDADNYEKEIALLAKEETLLSENNSEDEVLKEKKRLDQEIEDAQKYLKGFQIELQAALSGYEYAASCISISDQIVPYQEHQGSEVIEELFSILSKEDSIPHEKMDALSEITSRLENFLSPDGDYSKAIEDVESELAIEYRKIEGEHDTTKGILEKYRATGKTSYPNELDIQLLNVELPGAKARPICEFMEMIDPSWQGAIEGFLGNNRFSLMVEEEYEARAADIMLEKRRKSKIVQGAKLLNDIQKFTRETKATSITKLMKFTHPVAEAYMILNYGNVLQVKDTEALRFASRGLTKEGLGGSGYTMFRCLADKTDYFIGEKSRKERFEYYQEEEQAIIKRLSGANNALILAKQAKKKFASISLKDPTPTQHEISSLETRIEGAVQHIKSLKLSGQKEISSRLQQIVEAKKELKSKQKSAHIQVGEHGRDAESKQRAIDRTTQSLEQLRTELKEIEEILLSSLFGEANENKRQLENLRETAKQTFKNEERPVSFNDKTKDLFYAYKNMAESHNRESIHSAVISLLPETINSSIEAYRDITGLHEAHISVFAEVSENILIKKLDSLKEQKEEFNKTFKQEFCNRVHQSVDEGKGRLDKITNMLKKHQFGEERFVIKYKFSAEFKPIYDYFAHLIDNAPGTLTYSEELPEEHWEARDTIERLLAEGEEGKRYGELSRFADYRNYREYDIHKVLNSDEQHSVSLNKLATDSGGQATTSYYIIRSIAAYSAFDRDNPRYKKEGLGFLLIDEAFNRVDDRRPGTILNYLINELGFQIISAMPPQNENVFTEYTKGRYLIFKEVIDPSYDNYQVVQHAQYSTHNIKPISELLEAEKKRIKTEQLAMEFEHE